jgi:non-specific protein-tyrosine kinase
MEFKQYVDPLIKWWWLVLSSTLVAALASLLAVSRQPDLYQARAALMLGQAINNPNPTSNDFYLTEQLGQTYVNMSNREPVREATMTALGLTWLPGYTVTMVPNTQLLEIRVNDTSPERATAVANELAYQIVQSSPTSAQEQEEQDRQAFIKGQLDDLQVEIEATTEEITAKQAELAELFSARQIADTQSQIAALEAKLRTMQTNYVDLIYSTEQGAINSLSIFEEAMVPSWPIGPNRMSTVLTAAAIGFVLGAIAAYLLEYLDDTVKTPEDVEQLTELPTLAGIAAYEPDGDAQYSLITRNKPRSPIAEAYRGLRTAIIFTNVDKPTRSILITSPGPGEGKSLTAANLGVVMAQAGHRVLIVDADLRRPRQHKIFDLTGNYLGLTNLLLKMLIEQDDRAVTESTAELLEGAIHETQQPGLYLLTSGPLPPNPAELVGSEKMGRLLETLQAYFDMVIIDSPPCLAVTDAVVLSTRVDGVAMISNSGSTRRKQLQEAVARLNDVNANILGIILNRLTAKTGGYYYYYYYSRNYYSTDTDGDGDGAGGQDGRKRERRKRTASGERQWMPKFLVRPKN